jgi:hypothetical protein
MDGGAIHLQNSKDYLPGVVVLSNNKFIKNTAYFNGNAVYIDGFNTVFTDKNEFKMNQGRNLASGSALHICNSKEV